MNYIFHHLFLNAQIKKNHNVYLDTTYSIGSKFNQKQINAGYCFSF
ncbi:autotransporter outer membrane beta-barrel domain-containing protein [Neisseria sp. Ec49-e6-T10]